MKPEVITRCFKHIKECIPIKQKPLRLTIFLLAQRNCTEIIEEIAEESDDDDEASNDFDLPLRTPEVTSVKGALKIVHKLAEFSD